jgi:hypothetical protein
LGVSFLFFIYCKRGEYVIDRDNNLEDIENLPDPKVIVQAIISNLLAYKIEEST